MVPLGRAWVAGLLLLGVVCVGGTGSHVPELEVYRMVQYDQDDMSVGSRRSAISMLAMPSGVGGDASRRVVVLEFAQVTEALVDELLGGKPAGALLIILPEDLGQVSDKQRATWNKIESSLMSRDVPIPVYFAFDGEHARGIMERVKGNSGDVQLVVPGDHTPRTLKIESTNYQGIIAGVGESKAGGSSNNLPTIAVLANYDTFGIAPGLAVGSDSNGSGMIAVMMLARMFSKLYSGARTRGNYNLLFVLTGAGRLNYAGTKYFLSQTDVGMLEQVEFAVCLDSIGSGDKLYLHSSKPLKDATLSRVHSTFSSVAEDAGVKIEFVHKKINISDPTIFWEHEQFSRKKLLGFTLSGRSIPDSAARSSILDRGTMDQDVLKRNILIIAKSLAQHIYSLTEKLDIFSGSTGVQEHFIAAWSEALSREPRVAGYMDKSSLDLVSRAGEILTESCSDSSKQTFKIDSERQYYRGKLSTHMKVYTVRHISFDLLMTVCVLAYLLGLLVSLQGPSEAKKTLSDIFKGRGKILAKKRS